MIGAASIFSILILVPCVLYIGRVFFYYYYFLLDSASTTTNYNDIYNDNNYIYNYIYNSHRVMIAGRIKELLENLSASTQR